MQQLGNLYHFSLRQLAQAAIYTTYILCKHLHYLPEVESTRVARVTCGS